MNQLPCLFLPGLFREDLHIGFAVLFGDRQRDHGGLKVKPLRSHQRRQQAFDGLDLSCTLKVGPVHGPALPQAQLIGGTELCVMILIAGEQSGKLACMVSM